MKQYHYWDLYQNFRARCLAHGYEGTTRQQVALDKQIFEKFIRDNIKDGISMFVSRKK